MDNTKDTGETYVGGLEALEGTLSRRGGEVTYGKEKLTSMKPETVQTKNAWGESTGASPKKAKTFFVSGALVKLFFLSVFFFCIAAGIAAYRIFIAPILISPQNIEIAVQGPVSASGGEEVLFQVLVQNRNEVSLTATDLEITFPEGTRSPDTKEPLTRLTESLGPIRPNDSALESVKAILFGPENTEVTIGINLEYRIEGSSGTFSKKKEYKLVLVNAPVGLSISVPPEVGSGQDFELEIKAVSNSQAVLNDILVTVLYPYDFIFKGADPAPSYGNNIWKLGDLLPSKERTIQVRGVIDAQDEERMSFAITTGTADLKDNRKIGAVYNSINELISVKRPFIGATFILNDNIGSPFVAVPSGEKISGEIRWVNNLTTRVLDAEIAVRIDGPLLNKQSVEAVNGFYRSLDSTIVWNQSTDRTLALIEPGQSGAVTFSLSPFSLYGPHGTQFKKPTLTFSATIKGTRVSEGFSGTAVETNVSRQARVNTALQLATQVFHRDGPIMNTGPLPPRVDKETTYTVTWSLMNSSNTVTAGVVRARTPTYVRWLGVVSPSGESVTYNDVNGEITWVPGDIPAGVGFSSGKKEVSFQLGLTPSVSQLGTTPAIISRALAEGTDSFTQKLLQVTREALATDMLSDQSFDGEISGVVGN